MLEKCFVISWCVTECCSLNGTSFSLSLVKDIIIPQRWEKAIKTELNQIPVSKTFNCVITFMLMEHVANLFNIALHKNAARHQKVSHGTV